MGSYGSFEQLIQKTNDKYRLVKVVYPKGLGYVEHILDFYGFFLVCSGKMRYRLNGKEQILTKGTLQFIYPGDRHEILSIDPLENLVFLNADVSVPEMNRNFQFIIGKGVCNLTDCPQTITHLEDWQWNLFCNTFLQLLAHDNSGKESTAIRSILWHTLIQNLLSVLLQRTFYDFEIELPSWFKQAIMQMLKYENYTAGVTRFHELCRRSPEHVCRLMQKYYGTTPLAFVNNLRLDYAAEQLCKTKASITTITFDSGFNNLAYFRKCFKHKFDVTPREYRKRAQNMD